MPKERLSMRKTREILRQMWVLRHSYREIRDQLGVSLGAASRAVRRAEAVCLDWSQVQALSDEALDARLYGGVFAPGVERPKPDCAYLHAERKRPGVTLELLHLEYLEQHADGYRYTQFCHYYRDWLRKRRLSMRQVHRAGEKLFVDYSGKKPSIVDRHTGELIYVERHRCFSSVIRRYRSSASRRKQRLHRSAARRPWLLLPLLRRLSSR